MSKRDSIATLFLTAVLSAMVTLAVHSHFYHHASLVGYGCIGTNGPIYAEEEDHFPSCTRIERN